MVLATAVSGDSKFGPAKWIVSASLADGATNTTIQDAINSAVSGDTILVRDGTYTEDLALKAGISITAATGSSTTPTVTIIGNATFSATGTTAISNIRLQTNGNFLLTVSGANASLVNLLDCYLNCTNNTGISFTSSNPAANIFINKCGGDLGANVAMWVSSSAGTIDCESSRFGNSGGSTTATTCSAGSVAFERCLITIPISDTGTGSTLVFETAINTSGVNATCWTHNGATSNQTYGSIFLSGSASAISVGAGALLNVLLGNSFQSTNPNAITGAGTINFGVADFTSQPTFSSNVNVATQTCPIVGLAGTFVPVLAFGGSSVGITYAAQTGTYTRIGNVVFFNLTIALTSKGAQAGNATISGLPFVGDPTLVAPPLSVGATNLILNAGYSYFISDINAGTGNLEPFEIGSNNSALSLNNTNFNNTTTIETGGYFFAIT